MEQPTTPAGAENDMHTDPNDRTEATNGADKNYPSHMANRGEFGSPYGGTQSPDSRVPDGNQTPPRPNAEGKEVTPPELGDEYGSPSSYGEADSGGKEGEHPGNDAVGESPIR